ncbi:hypothetical protein H0H93_013315 [Arthromyces matolae]|nr:hypothetical protein H0H93_013315 [Arthromyces matolae]
MFWSNYTSTPPAMATGWSRLTQAPRDLLIEIALALESRGDVLSLALTSSYIYSHVACVLYESVTLKNVEQCNHTLSMLSEKPEIACHVRSLYIRPRSTSDCKHGVAVSLLASAAVRDAAATQRLEALTKFIWDADEKPYHEDMWFALRMGCPQLRYIGTSVGKYLPAYSSHLFDFDNLLGFSLTLKHGFYDTHMDTFLDEDTASSRQLWDMLIHRCPNLEELVIEGVSTLPTDFQALVRGRWPKLRKLALGDVSIDWTPVPPDQPNKRPFITFLEAHPSLESLSLSRYNVLPAHLRTIQQLQALPYHHSHIKSVTFRDPMLTREISTQAVAALLQGLPHLTELKDAFSKTIRGFPKLQTLNLTIVKYPGDGSLSAGAARIARANPRLAKFSLTFIPPNYPLSLPFSLPHPPFPLPARSTGSFELTTDRHGLPLSLLGLEQFRLVWPFGLGVSSSSRRYVRDLRPMSVQGRKKTGWRGLLGLLTEPSAAGEEMRMIVFCGLLVSLAMWGFSTQKPSHADVLEVMRAQGPPVIHGALSMAPVIRMQATAPALAPAVGSPEHKSLRVRELGIYELPTGEVFAIRRTRPPKEGAKDSIGWLDTLIFAVEVIRDASALVPFPYVKLAAGITKQLQEFNEYVKFRFRKRVGRAIVERGLYILCLQLVQGAQQPLGLTDATWLTLIKPGVTITMDIVLKSTSGDCESNGHRCPSCRRLCVGVSPGDEVKWSVTSKREKHAVPTLREL